MPLNHPLIILFAYLLDLMAGDPRWFPHPVKGIGWLIIQGELPFRKIFKSEKTAGLLFTVVIVASTGGISLFFIRYALWLNSQAGIIVSILLLYTCLSIKDLKAESMSVYHELKNNNLKKAREKLSMIVSRNTAGLDETAIIRATIETIAENCVDGIISPLFFSFLGGAPLALTYKAINTLDSMIGYQNRKYKNFGRAAAKLDDLANFIPARLSVLLLSLSSYLLGYNGKKAFLLALRDGGKNLSPNSGFPEAAVAGALQVKLGGPSTYDGKKINKAFLGDDIIPLSLADIKKALAIVYMCSFLTVSTGILLLWTIA